MKFSSYENEQFFDEMFESDGRVRPEAEPLSRMIDSLDEGELRRRQQAAERALLYSGITFAVYGDGAGKEKIFPFDIVPRVVPCNEWERIERGLCQRIRALNLFIDDIYHEQRVIKEGIIPDHVVFSATAFRKECVGLNPPQGIWCHITGTDLVRDSDGTVYVLEDNLRCPSGVSYVLENRRIMKQTFPQVFEHTRVRPVHDYCGKLLDMLQHLSQRETPRVAVLTPGSYNSAYFEHSFLAQQMGVQLVEGRDLVVKDGYVCMRTTGGFERVDVIYRRIDDAFLDPKAFRPDSLLGVEG